MVLEAKTLCHVLEIAAQRTVTLLPELRFRGRLQDDGKCLEQIVQAFGWTKVGNRYRSSVLMIPGSRRHVQKTPETQPTTDQMLEYRGHYRLREGVCEA